MKLITHQILQSLRMVELYVHSPIRHHGVVLKLHLVVVLKFVGPARPSCGLRRTAVMDTARISLNIFNSKKCFARTKVVEGNETHFVFSTFFPEVLWFPR
jgi:hypothetical protein